MADRFKIFPVSRSDPGQQHFIITPSNDALNPRPRALFINSNGTVTIEDAYGISISYNVISGQVLPFSATKVTAATATVIGWV